MSRVLIVYGTTDGHTAKVADATAAVLRHRDTDVDVANAAGVWDPDPRSYDAVIVAASVHARGYQRAVARWVKAHADALRDRPTAFVSVCLAVLSRSPKVDADLAAILQRFSHDTGWQPTETKVVAGALLYRQYGWLKRLVMRRIVRKAGGDTDTSRNYEYTDWKDLEEFTERFADACIPETARRL